MDVAEATEAMTAHLGGSISPASSASPRHDQSISGFPELTQQGVPVVPVSDHRARRYWYLLHIKILGCWLKPNNILLVEVGKR